MEGVFAGICRQYDRAEELLEEVLPYAHWGWASVIETQEGIVVTMCWLQASGLQGYRVTGCRVTLSWPFAGSRSLLERLLWLLVCV